MGTPRRYLSVSSRANDGTTVTHWRVIGYDGCPECWDTDRAGATAAYLAPWDRAWPRPSEPRPKNIGAIPVWDGDAGDWRTLAAYVSTDTAAALAYNVGAVSDMNRKNRK